MKAKTLLGLLLIISQDCLAETVLHHDSNASSVAKSSFIENSNISSNKHRYLPYLQLNSTRFFHTGDANLAFGADAFFPLWQAQDRLIFTDLRFYERSKKIFEGNAHFGYRQLLEDKQQLYGIYGAYDRRRTSTGNFFNQLTFGGECWFNRLFVGGNYYHPIGTTEQLESSTNIGEYRQNGVYKNLWLTQNQIYEKALSGVDGELGYEFVPGLVGYAGGYYFGGKDTDTIAGPKARVTYDFSLKGDKKILGLFDKVGLEGGVQRDGPRGVTGYLGANLKISLAPNEKSHLEGVSRHMVDLVRRDVDVVAIEAPKQIEEPYKVNGKVANILISRNEAELANARLDHNVDEIHVDAASFVNSSPNQPVALAALTGAVRDDARVKAYNSVWGDWVKTYGGMSYELSSFSSSREYSALSEEAQERVNILGHASKSDDLEERRREVPVVEEHHDPVIEGHAPDAVLDVHHNIHAAEQLIVEQQRARENAERLAAERLEQQRARENAERLAAERLEQQRVREEEQQRRVAELHARVLREHQVAEEADDGHMFGSLFDQHEGVEAPRDLATVGHDKQDLVVPTLLPDLPMPETQMRLVRLDENSDGKKIMYVEVNSSDKSSGSVTTWKVVLDDQDKWIAAKPGVQIPKEVQHSSTAVVRTWDARLAGNLLSITGSGKAAVNLDLGSIVLKGVPYSGALSTPSVAPTWAVHSSMPAFNVSGESTTVHSEILDKGEKDAKSKAGPGVYMSVFKTAEFPATTGKMRTVYIKVNEYDAEGGKKEDFWKVEVDREKDTFAVVPHFNKTDMLTGTVPYLDQSFDASIDSGSGSVLRIEDIQHQESMTLDMSKIGLLDKQYNGSLKEWTRMSGDRGLDSHKIWSSKYNFHNPHAISLSSRSSPLSLITGSHHLGLGGSIDDKAKSDILRSEQPKHEGTTMLAGSSPVKLEVISVAKGINPGVKLVYIKATYETGEKIWRLKIKPEGTFDLGKVETIGVDKPATMPRFSAVLHDNQLVVSGEGTSPLNFDIGKMIAQGTIHHTEKMMAQTSHRLIMPVATMKADGGYHFVADDSLLPQVASSAKKEEVVSNTPQASDLVFSDPSYSATGQTLDGVSQKDKTLIVLGVTDPVPAPLITADTSPSSAGLVAKLDSLQERIKGALASIDRSHDSAPAVSAVVDGSKGVVDKAGSASGSKLLGTVVMDDYAAKPAPLQMKITKTADADAGDKIIYIESVNGAETKLWQMRVKSSGSFDFGSNAVDDKKPSKGTFDAKIEGDKLVVTGAGGPLTFDVGKMIIENVEYVNGEPWVVL